ncbi:ComEC/Rec2 family competence protein [Jatrophihabitans fulvus]
MTPEREPLDVRLAVGAGAGWLAVLGLVDADSGRPALLVVVVAVVVAAMAFAVSYRAASPRCRVLARSCALAGCCVALVGLPLAARLTHAAESPLHALAVRHAAVTLELTVDGDPRLLAAKGPAGAARVAVDASAESVREDARAPVVPVNGSVLVLGDAGDWRDVLPGQRVSVTGSLQPDLDGGVLSVTVFQRGPPQLLDAPPWWQRAAGEVRASLRSAARVLPDQERGLLPGLVDGDTANLDPVLAEHFRAAGLTHLVAVSGTNCSIVIGAVLLVLRRMRARPWACAVGGALVLVTFVIVARPSPSVLRAAAMAAVALVALASGRPRAALPALSAVVLALLAWDPTLSGSPSFAMSVLATAGILVLAPGWARALRGRRVPVGLAESVAVAAAAHLVTMPVIAALSGTVSVVAVPANVLAEPVVAVTTVLGFLAAVAGPVCLPVATVFAWLAGWPCRWLTGVADLFGGLDNATLPWPGGSLGALALAGVLALLCLLALRTGLRHAFAAALVTAVVVLFPVRAATSGWPPDGWVFVACDVGQGDGLVLNAGGGAGVLVDAGPDPVPVDRCLRQLGITSLPLVAISHLHLDHVGGLAGAVRDRPVGRVIAGPLAEPVSGLDIVSRSIGAGHQVVSPRPGSVLTVGAVRLEVLGPARAEHGTRSDPNNSSLILRATVRGVRILLPGDAEIEEQDDVLDDPAGAPDLHADVLKVPHHGSAYSDPAFLAGVHARVAVVSVGAHNDYGHPSPVLLRELSVLGVPLLRTDRSGDVAVVTTGDGGLGTVVHRTGGTGASGAAAGLSALPGPSGLSGLSGHGARMAACPPVPSRPATSPTRCRSWSCSSATRTCSSTGPSARSPPWRARPIPAWSRPSTSAAASRATSCTSCSARPCSATRDSS